MKQRIGAVVLATIMLLTVGATAAYANPAKAGSTAALMFEVVVETTNDSAEAFLSVYNAWELSVCDNAKDGMRARAELRNLTTGRVIATAEDANGSFNTCDEGNHAYPTPELNDTVRVTVWVQDGASGSRRYSASQIY
ncbi:hypothetical protein [Polymorphospora sp. NPDC050346]|uniref:hypothetical protein n=1 Tax=Polymorphospora sp. NPDC050346 TaxID=3155780 RepID=UPI0034045FD0